MRYEGSQRDKKPLIDQVLSAINFILILVITFCLNYMVVKFLF